MCQLCSLEHKTKVYMDTKKFKIESLKSKNIPPFHPGCRCVVLPVI